MASPKGWATIKVKQAVYDKIRSLSDEMGVTQGDICDVLLGGGAEEIQRAVGELSRVTSAGAGLVTESPTGDEAAHTGAEATTVTKSPPVAEVAPLEAFALAVPEDDAEDVYACGACRTKLVAEYACCPECGVALNWSAAKEAGSAAKESGSSAPLLIGAALVALIALNRLRERPALVSTEHHPLGLLQALQLSR